MDISGFSFDCFYLDVKKKCLFKDSQNIKISPRTFQLLHILAKASPDPVNKEQLNSLLWPNTIVSEWSVARLISDTRMLLGDDGNQQKYIQTMRGTGFYMPSVLTHQKEKSEKSTNVNFSLLFSGFILIILLTSYFYWQKSTNTNLKEVIQQISYYQDNTYTAFKAQLERRKQLATLIEQRFTVKRERQWEMFFSHYYSRMNKDELFVCEQMRAITDHGLYENNLAIFNLLKNTPDIYKKVPLTQELYQHLNFWLKKYDNIFQLREDMCLLYVGVEDAVPYPSGVDKNIKIWLKNH